MTESNGKITRDKLISACNEIQSNLNILKATIENPKISEIDILRILKSSELGILVTKYVSLIEKQQHLLEMQNKSNKVYK